MCSPTSLLAGIDRRAWVALAATLIAAVVAASAGGVFISRSSRPASLALDLRDGQTEVATDRVLTLTADRPVDPAGFRLTPAAEGALAGDGRRFSWKPSQPLVDLTPYRVSVSGLRDRAGHRVPDRAWRFTTTIVPRVMGLALDSGAALGDSAEVPVGSPLVVSFNEAMDQSTTRLLANGAPVALTWDGSGRAAKLDTRALRVGPVEFGLDVASRDGSGRPAAAWSLKTDFVFWTTAHTVPLQSPALVQVTNDPAARDQSGLQSADVVFEYLAEGGITRMTALFTHAPDTVGPVRSGRTISFSLTRHYHGTNVFSGLSGGAFGRLRADPVPALFDTPGFFYRSPARVAPDNLYIRGSVLQAVAGHLAPFTPKTGAPAPGGGEPASSAAVPEHRSAYAYDEATGTYTKTEEGHLMGDASVLQPLRIRLLS